LEDASAVVVLTVTEYAARARAMVASSVSVVDLSAADAPSSANGATAVRSPGPDDPAYIIFTSGSTGRPKGVMIPHHAIVDHVLETAEFYSMGPKDAALLTITINFDPHLMQALTPLVVGAGLVIAKPDGHADGDYITGLISQHGVTHFNSTPSLAFVQFQGKDVQNCGSLRFCMLGGEQLPREVISMFENKMPSCRVVNVYGPTEATITATALLCPPSIDFISIGRPVYNLHCYVVDSKLRAVPVGVPGELMLSGPRLALGYAGRPDLTEEKFVPNPCLDLVSGRVDPALAPYYEKAYRSGDLVRWRNDGTIDFLGRIDRQVKITGVRIELGEVESALESTVGVTQSVATALVDPSGQKRLVGYVTPATVEPATVRAHCRSLLVPAMVPTVIVALESFPLLPGGKIDVRGLPTPDWSAPTGAVATASGSFTVDKDDATVISIILEVIGLEQNAKIPLSTDIFDLGASSLHVSLIVGRMRRELGVNLDVREVYGNPTVKTLCDALRQQNSDAGGKLNSFGIFGVLTEFFLNSFSPLLPFIFNLQVPRGSNPRLRIVYLDILFLCGIVHLCKRGFFVL
jgi:nonribosomal peptide synthetase DhbF